jgi:hypothetical protein
LVGLLTILAIYCPLRHSKRKGQFEDIYSTPGHGDYNAKHTEWGSRPITPKGHELPKKAGFQEVTCSLNHKKSLSYSLNNGKILREVPIIAIKYLTHLFDTVLPKGYFPAQWKIELIIFTLKPGKLPNV